MTDGEWKPNWRAIADRIVNGTLRLTPGERVVYLVDPYDQPELLEEIRAAVLSAGGIEHATLLGWTSKLQRLRNFMGQHDDPAAAERERNAHRDLISTADVLLWLPVNWTVWEPEWLVMNWRGRSVHCHWYWDPVASRGDPVQVELHKALERAIVDVDYDRLRARQERLRDAIRGRTVRISTPQGTDLRFKCPRDGWYHLNDGIASREKAMQGTCTRDREEEIPAGAVRTRPTEDSVEGVIAVRRGRPPVDGWGFPAPEFAHDVDFVFSKGRVVELRSKACQDRLNEIRSTFTGDWDRLGAVGFGTNPLLTTPKEVAFPNYYGKGEGMLRLQLGGNVESGGHYVSNLWLHLYFDNATIEVDGNVFQKDGVLLL
jgi:leucyl aminopeptidase (aminopeptidase T)